ncbi:hypothetical protein MRX96_000860 [Rhipicephalus microplus]
MADCVHLEHFMCSRTGKMDIGSTLVTSMLSMVVCILKKLPFFNVLRLLREVVCNFLTLVVSFFRNNKRLSFMAPLMELVQIILQCKIEETLPMPPVALPTAAPELPPTAPPQELPSGVPPKEGSSPLLPTESSPVPTPTAAPSAPSTLYPSLSPETASSVPSETATSAPTDVSFVPSEALIEAADASPAAVKTSFSPENGPAGFNVNDQ